MKIVVFNQAPEAELVEKHAEETANALALTGSKDIKTTKSQLRRFYQEWVTLRDRTHTKGFDKSIVGIKMLIAKAAYASGRENAKVPQDFVEWLKANLTEIRQPTDVDIFGNYFEAMVGYFYAAHGQRSGGRDR